MDSMNIDKKRLYDVVIVGGGPAGLTAAIYLARARYRVLVIEKNHFGGQITITSEVVNYPGIPKCSGTELTANMRAQAQAFGAEFLLAEVSGLELSREFKTVRTVRGDYYAYGILLATGAHPRTVGFAGEEEHKGRGVAYCATCDGEFFTRKELFVIGGGFAAAEESVFLTKFARHVTILIREDDFTCARTAAQAARDHEKITVLTNITVQEVSGENGLDYIRYQNTKTGETTEYTAPEGETFGVFVFAGYAPETSLVKGLAELNEQGYVLTDRTQKTSVEGIYAAGDVCVKPLRQVVTAVGDGALAATELEKYAAALQEKTGIVPRPEDFTEGMGAGQGAYRSGMVQDHPTASASQDGHSSQGPYGGQAVSGSGDGLFDSAMLAQLNAVFAKMASPLTLKLYLNDAPISAELKQYMDALAALTDKLIVELSTEDLPDAPCVKIFRKDGSYSGLAFHGVPGGHEFTSFVLGLYNAAGPGQSLDPQTAADIGRIQTAADLKILVSLSCTMCPELVTAAQRIAAANPQVTAEVYDLNHFPALREKYKVMSVPCMIINETQVVFGKKTLPQLLDLLLKNKTA